MHKSEAMKGSLLGRQMALRLRQLAIFASGSVKIKLLLCCCVVPLCHLLASSAASFMGWRHRYASVDRFASRGRDKQIQELVAVKYIERGEKMDENVKREKGRVGFPVYWKYITIAYGGALVPFILLAQVLFQALQIGSNYWMAWAIPVSKDVAAEIKGSTLILVYVALAIGSSFCIIARALLLATAGYKTATLLFKRMHLCIFRAPMSFFDATPSGRILNRACLTSKISAAHVI